MQSHHHRAEMLPLGGIIQHGIPRGEFGGLDERGGGGIEGGGGGDGAGGFGVGGGVLFFCGGGRVERFDGWSITVF